MPRLDMVRALFLGLALFAAISPADAQEAIAGEPAPTAKVRELLTLMDDPQVRQWLGDRRTEDPATSPPAAPAGAMMGDMTAPVMAIRHHVLASLGAIPTALPELARVGKAIGLEIAAQGLWETILLVVMFLGLGFLVERLYWRATTGFRRRLIAMPLETVQERLRAVALRLGFGLAWTASFAVGSLGAFLLFAWPPLLHTLIARLLLLVVVVWLTTILLRFVIAPGAERFRILPIGTASARHWYVWLTLAVGWYFGAHLLHGFLIELGLAEPVQILLADIFSMIWLGIVLLALWRRPALRPEVEPNPERRAAARLRNTLLTVALVLVWLLVPIGAVKLFYTLVVLAGLAALLRITNLSVGHILRPAGSEQAEAVPPLVSAVLDRGLRALWIIGAGLLLAWIWEVDVNAMAGDTTLSRLLRGTLHAVVIVLVVELVWHIVRTWIDRSLADARATAGPDTPEAAQRRARVRTLLPIARNVLFVVLLVMAALMALSALGIEVGPLIAGAGVVGVAIGFGSQTLVKDVISGVFFLLDDAFRVGEYIESGSIRGTVEGFSLRSIKLRHHRGYLHTVPFGSLDKITNYSRDWVIDKVTIGLTYDTDLDKVKRIIKQIGRELLADPEMAPHIIDTLKMQGVEEYGDFAIKVRLKLTSKPGEQFVIRRRAYGMIKKAFDENGIKFAFPTVQVAGGEHGAAAQTALDALQKPAA
ncbi:MAG: mechanosensitive ion channel family protein [Geminicoccaceae bacterium]